MRARQPQAARSTDFAALHGMRIEEGEGSRVCLGTFITPALTPVAMRRHLSVTHALRPRTALSSSIRSNALAAPIPSTGNRCDRSATVEGTGAASRGVAHDASVRNPRAAPNVERQTAFRGLCRGADLPDRGHLCSVTGVKRQAPNLVVVPRERWQAELPDGSRSSANPFARRQPCRVARSELEPADAADTI